MGFEKLENVSRVSLYSNKYVKLVPIFSRIKRLRLATILNKILKNKI
jgi:hypothetical protein